MARRFILPSGLSLFVCLAASFLDAPVALGDEVGNNFTGTNSTQAGSFPVDAMGAVGTNYFVEMVNGAYAVYRKATGALVSSRTTLDTFWNAALAAGGGGSVGSATFDPRIIYDSASGRWFAAAADNRQGANNLLVAVSNASDPTQGWKAFKIDTDPSDLNWADSPSLGVNADGVFITADNRSIVSGALQSVSIVSIPKNDLLLAAPTIANRSAYLSESSSSRGFSLKPASDFGSSGGQALLLAADVSNTTRFKLTRISNVAVQSPQAATLSSATNVTGVQNTAPPAARQPDGSQNLDSGDRRISASVYKVGNVLWSAHSISDAGQVSIAWEEVNATSGTLINHGKFAVPGFDLLYPSICANNQGDVVLGFTKVGATESPSAYAAVGLAANDDPFVNSILLKAGVTGGSYHVTHGDPAQINRWGNYSATSLDPTDQGIFWTIQPWQSADDPQSNAVLDQNDQWSTQISEIIPAHAQEIRWADATNGSFATSQNWRGGTAPISDSHTIFSRPIDPSVGGYVVSFAADTTNDRLSVRQGAVTLNLGGKTYSLTNASAISASVTIGEFAGSSELTVLAGTISSINATIAPGTLATATVIIGSGATWSNSASLFVGGSNSAAGGNGALTVQQNGAVELTTGDELLEVWPTGTLNLAGGTVGGAGDIDVQGLLTLSGASTKFGSGTMTVRGPVSWSAASSLTVNGSTNGKLVLSCAGGTASVADNVSTLTVNSGATLELAGTAATTSDGTHHVNLLNGGSLNVTGTNQAVGNLDGAGSTTISPGGSLTASRVVQDDLSISQTNQPSASVMVRRSGGTPQGSDAQASVLGGLDLANDNAPITAPPEGGYSSPLRQYFGKLDLVNNDLIIKNVSPSQAAEVMDMVRAGFFTNGAEGITSSEALSSGDFAGLTMLGAVWNTYYSDINAPGSGSPIFPEFDGVPLSGGELIIKYTWFGDADLSGLVDVGDAALYTTGLFQQDPNTLYNPWFFGDFDYTAVVDGGDAALYTTGLFNGGQTIHLPEPSGLALVVVAFCCLLVARPRRRTIRRPV